LRRVLCVSLVMAASCTLLLVAAALAKTASTTERLGWMLPKEVSQSDQASSQGPQLVIEENGFLHLMWMDSTTGQLDPYYVQSTDRGNNWSAGDRFATDQESHQARIALGTEDVLHTCWWEGTYPALQYLYYAERAEGSWGIKETVFVTDSEIREPSVVEAAGYVHVVWSNKLALHFDLFYSTKATNTLTWMDPVFVTDTIFSSRSPRMAADGYGNLHVVWQENSSPNEIMYISGTVGAGQTTWSDSITITEKVANGATNPHIAVDQDKVAHVVFAVDVAGQIDTQDIYHASFPISNTDHISPTLVGESRVVVSRQLPTYASPVVACDGPDDLHLAWNGIRGGDISDRIYYAVSHDGGATWSQPIAVSPDDAWADGFPTLGTDGTLCHVAWQQEELGSDNDIYYAHSLPLVYHFALGLKGY